jgi:hypothetical protein
VGSKINWVNNNMVINMFKNIFKFKFTKFTKFINGFNKNPMTSKSKFTLATLMSIPIGISRYYLTNDNKLKKENKTEPVFNDGFKERQQKDEQYKNKPDDGVRKAFVHSDFTEDQIIEFLIKNKIDVNSHTHSTVVGEFIPVFFWSVHQQFQGEQKNKTKVLDYLLDNKLVDPTKTVDLSTQNMFYWDVLEECPENRIQKLIDYGFKLHRPVNQYDKYMDVMFVDRLYKFLEHGLIKMEDIKPLLTEENLINAVRRTNERNWCDFTGLGLGVKGLRENERKLIKFLDLYEKNNVKINNRDIRSGILNWHELGITEEPNLFFMAAVKYDKLSPYYVKKE